MSDTDSDRLHPRPEEPDLPERRAVEDALEGLVRAVLPRDAQRPRGPSQRSEPARDARPDMSPASLKFAAKRAD